MTRQEALQKARTAKQASTRKKTIDVTKRALIRFSDAIMALSPCNFSRFVVFSKDFAITIPIYILK